MVVSSTCASIPLCSFTTPLGAAGGAARVEDELDVRVGQGARCRVDGPALGQRRRVVLARVVAADLQHQIQARQGLAVPLRLVVVHDPGPRARVGQHVLDLVRRLADVQRHEDQARLGEAEHDLGPLRTVASRHRHPVARGQAPVEQVCGQPVRAFVECGPGEAGVAVPQRGLRGKSSTVATGDVTDEHDASLS
jgi:hypothetical protein